MNEQIRIGTHPEKCYKLTIEQMILTWREEARLLRTRYGQEGCARLCEALAQELEALLYEQGEQILSLAAAARESGYSAGHLGRLVREGKIPNAGRLYAPKIWTRDLPRKACALQNDHAPAPAGDRLQIARSIVNLNG